MTDRAWGYHKIEDERDKKFAIRPSDVYTAETRTKRYWWDTFWAGNQTSTPQCVGYAWSHWLANYPRLQWLNPTGIYEMCQHIDEWVGTEYEGTSVRAGAKLLHKLGYIDEYRWVKSHYTLTKLLLHSGPVVAGTAWYEGMMYPDSTGLIHRTGGVTGGHAYLINGYSETTRLLRIKNSWGNAWGKQGRGYMHIDEFKVLMQSGEVCFAREKRPAPF